MPSRVLNHLWDNEISVVNAVSMADIVNFVPWCAHVTSSNCHQKDCTSRKPWVYSNGTLDNLFFFPGHWAQHSHIRKMTKQESLFYFIHLFKRHRMKGAKVAVQTVVAADSNPKPPAISAWTPFLVCKQISFFPPLFNLALPPVKIRGNSGE